MNIKNPLHYSILLYLIVIIFIIYLKPKMIFTKDGEIRNFGINDGDTIYPLWLVTIFIAILCYYLVSFVFILHK